MVVRKRWFGRKRIDQFEGGSWSESHSYRDCAIELYDRGWDELRELIVEFHNPRPVCLFRRPRSCVTCGDAWTA
jgi:hypothetical protein